MSRYFALLDGKPGAFGVAFPDAPGCTAMGATEDEALGNAVVALAEWYEHGVANTLWTAAPRELATLRLDREVMEALTEGAVFVSVPLVRETAKPVRANISVDGGVLEAIDGAAKRAGQTRSAFLVSAALEKIKASV